RPPPGRVLAHLPRSRRYHPRGRQPGGDPARACCGARPARSCAEIGVEKMATALERVMSGPAPTEVVKEQRPRPAALLYGPLAIALVVVGAVVARDAEGQVGQWVRVALVVFWAIAGM